MKYNEKVNVFFCVAYNLFYYYYFLVTEHYSGNKHRNAQVRQDFPCAVDEQVREQHLAEQAAALYHQMILEQ